MWAQLTRSKTVPNLGPSVASFSYVRSLERHEPSTGVNRHHISRSGDQRI